jgi:hypothetical protein
MGYTHYWDKGQGFTQGQWEKLTACTAFLLINSDTPVSFEYNEDRPVQIDNERIRFNGIEEDGHETFILDRENLFAFCKTAMKPYDKLVVAILHLAELIAPGSLNFSSDGDDEDLAEGIALAVATLKKFEEEGLSNESWEKLLKPKCKEEKTSDELPTYLL